MKQQLAHWKGSVHTADAVREEIARRYREEEAKNYDPAVNCFTLPTWNKLGYKVRKGEQSIRSMTLIEAEDENAKEGEQTEKGHSSLAIAQVKVWIKDVEFKPVGYGQSRVTKGDVGDAKKGAQTDAIKKALSYFSIGNRAYHGLLKAA